MQTFEGETVNRIPIKRNSARKNALKKKAQHEKNMLIRANLYKKFRGEVKSPHELNEWHETLKALSMGTA